MRRVRYCHSRSDEATVQPRGQGPRDTGAIPRVKSLGGKPLPEEGEASRALREAVGVGAQGDRPQAGTRVGWIVWLAWGSRAHSEE